MREWVKLGVLMGAGAAVGAISCAAVLAVPFARAVNWLREG